MRSHDKLKINRQEIRRDGKRTPLNRCPICGKTSNRHNNAVHDRANKSK